MPNKQMNPSGAFFMNSNASFQPQYQCMFDVIIMGLDDLTTVDTGSSIPIDSQDELKISTKSFTLPELSTEIVSISYGTDTIKFAGRPTVGDVTWVLRDMIGPNTSKIAMAWFSKVFNMKNETNGLITDYKKTIYLTKYDPQGGNARRFKLSGCFPKSVGGQEFDYDQSGVVTQSITLSVDWFMELDT